MNNAKDLTGVRQIDCLEAIEALYAWLDGELESPESVAEFEQHLEHCRSCYSRSEMEKVLTERMRHSSQKKAPDAVKKRVQDLIKKL